MSALIARTYTHALHKLSLPLRVPAYPQLFYLYIVIYIYLVIVRVIGKDYLT